MTVEKQINMVNKTFGYIFLSWNVNIGVYKCIKQCNSVSKDGGESVWEAFEMESMQPV